MRNVRSYFVVAALFVVLAPGFSAATTVPVGVQNDLSLSALLADGWTIAFQNTYDEDSVPISTVFANATGTHVMLAAKLHNTGTIDVAAAATLAEITTYTAQDVTHTANGAEWYYNGSSMGFVGLGDTILQFQADVSAQNERDRLSWHTSVLGNIGDYSTTPDALRFGWRSGNNVDLNYTPEWDRLILTATVSAVPLPSAVHAGFGLICLCSLAKLTRRKMSRTADAF